MRDKLAAVDWIDSEGISLWPLAEYVALVLGFPIGSYMAVLKTWPPRPRCTIEFSYCIYLLSFSQLTVTGCFSHTTYIFYSSVLISTHNIEDRFPAWSSISSRIYFNVSCYRTEKETKINLIATIPRRTTSWTRDRLLHSYSVMVRRR